MSRLITATRLARLLRFHEETLRGWRRDGVLPHSVIQDGVIRYSPRVVDKILSAAARNFEQPPTVAALLSGQLQLLLPSEASRLLGMSIDALYSRVRTGKLAVIRFKSDLRLSAASVHSYREEMTDERLVHRPLARHVLGVSTSVLIALVGRGELKCIESVHDPHHHPVTRESLLRLLRRLLPEWIEPFVWFRTRLADPRPLLRLREVALYLGLDARGRDVRELIDAQQLWYVKTPSGVEFRVSPRSVDAVLEQQPPLKPQQIADLFGASWEEATRWIANGDLFCSLHTHKDTLVRRACMIQLLRSYLSPQMKPQAWFEQRLNDPLPLYDVVELAARVARSTTEIEEMIGKGEIQGIQLPGDAGWRFTRKQIQKISSRLRS